MNCTNCGKTNLKNAVTCIHCGAEIINDTFPDRGVHDKANHSDFLSGSKFIENKKMDLENLAFINQQEKKFSNGGIIIESQTLVAEEPITIREREKRIIEERIKKEIAAARELRRISDLEAHDLARADRERRKQEKLKAEQESISHPKIQKENGEIKEIPLSEIKIVKRRKKSKFNRGLSKFLFYFCGITMFLFIMGYLFWRFAPSNEIYKTEFVEWMKLNSNENVNNFIFNTMGLNSYYTPPRVVDFTGLYVSKDGKTGELFDLVYKGMKLTGSYTIGEKQFSLNGFADNKGEFLVMETLAGNPSAIIKGTIFSTGYLSAERFEQATGHKQIISLQKN